MGTGRESRPGGPLDRLQADIVRCRACPRLVAWREEVARVKRRAYRGEAYWGRPVPSFGDRAARVVLVGLAPGAHGANRTGRMFTGDRSGDFLYAALWRAGLASQPTSLTRGDGLTLSGAWITAACRCAPPDNRPETSELARCAPFLDRELALLPRARVVVALGAIAWRAALRALARKGHAVPRPAPRFGHGVVVEIPGGPALVGSYHPSQQNTLTGRLTAAMLDALLGRAVSIARVRRSSARPAARSPRPPRRA